MELDHADTAPPPPPPTIAADILRLLATTRTYTMHDLCTTISSACFDATLHTAPVVLRHLMPWLHGIRDTHPHVCAYWRVAAEGGEEHSMVQALELALGCRLVTEEGAPTAVVSGGGGRALQTSPQKKRSRDTMMKMQPDPTEAAAVRARKARVIAASRRAAEEDEVKDEMKDDTREWMEIAQVLQDSGWQVPLSGPSCTPRDTVQERCSAWLRHGVPSDTVIGSRAPATEAIAALACCMARGRRTAGNQWIALVKLVQEVAELPSIEELAKGTLRWQVAHMALWMAANQRLWERLAELVAPGVHGGAGGDAPHGDEDIRFIRLAKIRMLALCHVNETERQFWRQQSTAAATQLQAHKVFRQALCNNVATLRRARNNPWWYRLGKSILVGAASSAAAVAVAASGVVPLAMVPFWPILVPIVCILLNGAIQGVGSGALTASAWLPMAWWGAMNPTSMIVSPAIMVMGGLSLLMGAAKATHWAYHKRVTATTFGLSASTTLSRDDKKKAAVARQVFVERTIRECMEHWPREPREGLAFNADTLLAAPADAALLHTAPLHSRLASILGAVRRFVDKSVDGDPNSPTTNKTLAKALQDEVDLLHSSSVPSSVVASLQAIAWLLNPASAPVDADRDAWELMWQATSTSPEPVVRVQVQHWETRVFNMMNSPTRPVGVLKLTAFAKRIRIDDMVLMWCRRRQHLLADTANRAVAPVTALFMDVGLALHAAMVRCKEAVDNMETTTNASVPQRMVAGLLCDTVYALAQCSQDWASIHKLEDLMVEDAQTADETLFCVPHVPAAIAAGLDCSHLLARLDAHVRVLCTLPENVRAKGTKGTKGANGTKGTKGTKEESKASKDPKGLSDLEVAEATEAVKATEAAEEAERKRVVTETMMLLPQLHQDLCRALPARIRHYVVAISSCTTDEARKTQVLDAILRASKDDTIWDRLTLKACTQVAQRTASAIVSSLKSVVTRSAAILTAGTGMVSISLSTIGVNILWSISSFGMLCLVFGAGAALALLYHNRKRILSWVKSEWGFTSSATGVLQQLGVNLSGPLPALHQRTIRPLLPDDQAMTVPTLHDSDIETYLPEGSK